LTAAVLWTIVYPWIYRLDLEDPSFARLARLNAAIWLLILWWSLHQLTFQIAALLKLPANRNLGTQGRAVSFAILYLTCDDFDAAACESCLAQDYDTSLFKVFICDDGGDGNIRSEIDQFEAQYSPRLKILRRPDRNGFKAGNLNHAFGCKECCDADWIVIVDADQSLPRGYLMQLAQVIADQPEDVAFAQTGHDPAADTDSTRFQQALGPEVRLFYERDLALRQKCGFLPALGHGMAVRSSSWNKLAGFPELVSEDYAFALKVSGNGLRGIYIEEICSTEAFPRDFGAFIVRLRKFAGGSAELIRSTIARHFFLSQASFVEKLDFGMLLLWYPLLPLLLFNGFLSAYVCHHWWTLKISALHPVLPYIFLSMFLLTIPVISSAAYGWRSSVRYWFWSVAIYSAAVPIGSWSFLLHLFRKPTFERTPKRGGEPYKLGLGSLGTLLLGLLAIGLSILWRSPFSPVLAAYGTAYTCFPIFHTLHKQSLAGRLARVFIWFPGTLFLLALYTMWLWGRL
jgi:cellulose synthase/poly-beta-1,6-N-acetylglucosamine synthase-like glycosyltransferase